MARLIIHSDDLGLHQAVNDSIFKAAEKKVLTSTSLLANGWAVDDALQRYTDFVGLGVGIHLNIVRGKPLSDPSEIPSLVDGNGHFLNSPVKLWWRSLIGELSIKEIEKEWLLQGKKLIEKGLQPTHLDSEKHMHIFLPQAREAVVTVADQLNISKIRMIRENPLLKNLKSNKQLATGLGQKAKLSLLERSANKAALMWQGKSWADYSLGVAMSGQGQNRQALLEVMDDLLTQEGDEVIEWIAHLGFDAEMSGDVFAKEFGRFHLQTARQEEEKFLLDRQTKKLLHSHHQKLISYREV